MNKVKGVIAAGHEQTVQAAEDILSSGGNAFDAILAAHFAACIAEPVLASLAGGGFLLAHEANKPAVVYDFFVQTPINKKEIKELEFKPVHADFGTVTQEFHIGAGSLATPGIPKGIFQVHRDLCSMPMPELAAPAIQLAKEGLKVNSFQAYIIDIIKPILLSTFDASILFASSHDDRDVIGEGEILRMPHMADFIDALSREGDQLFYIGEVAQAIHELSRERGGYLTKQDLASYQVKKRKPLQFSYGENTILCNPPPSSGGLLIAFAMQLLEKVNLKQFKFGTHSHLHTLIEAMAQTYKARIDNHISNCHDELAMLNDDFVSQYRKTVFNRAQSLRGTTHISVIDHSGNSASMTVSNGESCGYLIPGTGVLLNNMLGEEDLNPGGFHQWRCNQRMTSMMSPSMILNGEDTVALGSGGSNRIRTAILQTLINLLEYDMSLEQAVRAPRVHFENDMLNIEKGFPKASIEHLTSEYPQHKTWQDINLFFGGTHAVQRKGGKYSAVGDPRRGGVACFVHG